MDVSECLNSFSELCGQILLDLRNFGNVFCVVQQMRMKGSHVVDYLLNGVPILVLAGASEQGGKLSDVFPDGFCFFLIPDNAVEQRFDIFCFNCF